MPKGSFLYAHKHMHILTNTYTHTTKTTTTTTTNPAPVLENNTHKLQWDFDIHTDHRISSKKTDLIIINKKKEKFQNCQLCCPS